VPNQPPISSTTGTLTDVNPQNNTVTLQTDKGPKTFTIDPQTGLFLNGQICSLQEVDLAQAAGQAPSCTVYYYLNAQNEAVYIDFSGPQPAAAVSGPIIDVSNPPTGQSTITVQTPKGPVTFDVDPTTGIILNSQVCTLDQLDAIQAAGITPTCTVFYYQDETGTAVFVDANLPTGVGVIQGSLTDVNAQNNTVTVQTDTGTKTLTIDPATGLFLSGQVCSLAELDTAQAQLKTPECTVYYLLNNQNKAIYVDVPVLQSVTGTLFDVTPGPNPFITIKTSSGAQQTFAVDAATGLILGGSVCTLDQLDAIQATGKTPSCTVYYYQDESGNAVYVDVTKP